jgi:hypothetical protein
MELQTIVTERWAIRDDGPPGTGPFKIRADIIDPFDSKHGARNSTGVGVGAPRFSPRRGFFAGLSKAL